jgi:hypothetical protein
VWTTPCYSGLISSTRSFQIGAFIHRHPRIRRFTTVYDLIPITNPEFFGAGNVPQLLESIVGVLNEMTGPCVSLMHSGGPT